MNRFNKYVEMGSITVIQMLRIVPILMLSLMFPVKVFAVDAGYLLKNIDYVSLPGDKVQIRLEFDRPLQAAPSSFSIDRPARVSLDIPHASLTLENKSVRVDTGVVSNVRAVEGAGRSRVVIGLNTMVPYEIRQESSYVYINFESTASVAAKVVPEALAEGRSSEVNELNFRRTPEGGATIDVSLSNVNTVVNMQEKGTKIVVDFVNTKLVDKLVRRLDVTDFATPVSMIDAFNIGTGARMVIEAHGDYEHMAYQTGNNFTVNISPLSEEEVAEKKKDKYGYSGEKLSLNFQNIEVRAVLQLLADFTGLNVVASDSVQGNITLRLKNVPWDQALDIILRTRGLGKRQTGNVMLIAPNAEISAREKEELEAAKQRIDLAPVRTMYHQINYAKAADIAKLLKGDKNSILTERGSVSIDDRTNTLMILETAEKHEEISAIVKQLDVPVKQVMIESRIVVANDEFGRDLGVRTGFTQWDPRSNGKMNALTGSSAGADTMVGSYADSVAAGDNPVTFDVASQGDRYNVNLPAGGSAGRLALALLGGDYLVDLELSALQTEGKGEVLSNPRVITSNQQTATIEQGVEIAYQEASSSGATSTSFKKAVLSLKVTPQITPDDRVFMDLDVSKDSVGGIYSGVPSINTRSVTTQVLVNNGDTVVLGGIYEQETSDGETKVPLLGDIPILGYLFRTKSVKETRGELLIFVTPKILKDQINTAGM